MSVVIGVLLLAISMYVAIASRNSGEHSQRELNGFQDIVFSGSDGFVEHESASTHIPAVTGIEVKSDETEQEIHIENPSDNPCVFVVSLYLGDGTLLWQTSPIQPGCAVDNIKMRRTLDSGVYKNAVMVYDCFSADGNMIPLTRCEFVIEINSI